MSRLIRSVPAHTPTIGLALALAAACAPPPHSPSASPADRFPDADSVRDLTLADGVRHLYLRSDRGPWAIHIVEVDESRCRPDIRAVKAGPPMRERATTSALAGDALAAINADFFLLPRGTPVGAHVLDGRVLVGPGPRPVYLLDLRGRHYAGTAAIHGFAARHADTVAIAQVNRLTDADGLVLLHEWAGDDMATAEGTTAATIRLLDDGRALVLAHHDGPETAIHIEPGAAALLARHGTDAGWLRGLAPGDTLTWAVRLVPAPDADLDDPAPATQAVGGYPLLVHNGHDVLAAQEGLARGFAEARHPRTAIGWDEPGRRLFWVVVDGRRPGYSEGMSLAELQRLFIELGATHAINLDGGGSTTLVVRGEVANQPSDPLGERAVANALVLEGCGGSSER